MVALPTSFPKNCTLSCAPMPLHSNSHLGFCPKSLINLKICSSPGKSAKIDETRLQFVAFMEKNPTSKLEASREPQWLTQEPTNNELEILGETGASLDPFDEMKHRFLSFKRLQYLENSARFQKLAKGQAPKFMVIACADSRVCPSNILGFQPGEAFTVRNVANLIPPFENGISETSAALEFAVNFVKVENLLVIGHSCCGGIQALMSMPDELDSSLLRGWVVVGKKAKLSTKAATENLSFEQQCRHCEKESVNQSLRNLLTYPWIEEKVAQGTLSVHGGYYDFVNCTFEKWTLEHNRSEDGNEYAIAERSIWC
eukprot:TRINITY_DN14340_c0_g1_i1.p1 TRINITY_DN14340_c0_g1~~TRINITY_DN14340_c0_g1_i1.p1  ORF type:complete len:314 (+),score=43.02 TRINITY_DN14340_c0_g1_i1:254-1195(+)